MQVIVSLRILKKWPLTDRERALEEGQRDYWKGEARRVLQRLKLMEPLPLP